MPPVCCITLFAAGEAGIVCLSDFRSARMAAANRFSRWAHPVAAVLRGAQIVRIASAVGRKETPSAGAVCFRAA